MKLKYKLILFILFWGTHPLFSEMIQGTLAASNTTVENSAAHNSITIQYPFRLTGWSSTNPCSIMVTGPDGASLFSWSVGSNDGCSITYSTSYFPANSTLYIYASPATYPKHSSTEFDVSYTYDFNTEYITNISFSGEAGEVDCITYLNTTSPTINYIESDDSGSDIQFSHFNITVTTIDGTTTYFTGTTTFYDCQLTGLQANTPLVAKITPIDTLGVAGTPLISSTFEVNPDDPITIGIVPQPDSVSWSSSPALDLGTIAITDDLGLGYSSASYTIYYSADGSTSNETQVFQRSVESGSGAISIFLSSGSINKNGYYFLSVTAWSQFGLTKTASQLIYQYDSSSPVISGLTATLNANASSIIVTWEATEVISGVDSCTLNYIVNDAPQNAVVSRNGDQYTSTILLLSPLYGATPLFSITATSVAGVTSTASTVSLAVPPSLTFGAVVETTEQVNQPYMEVDLSFGQLSVNALQRLSSLVITRSLASTVNVPVSLPTLTLDLTTIEPANIDQSSASPGGNPWKTDNMGNVVYVDYIPVSSHAGHKMWTYALSAIYKTAQWSAISNSNQSVTLPNNQGSLVNANTFTVLDMSGNVQGSPGFKIGSDGIVQIQFQGSDPDQDPWSANIYRVYGNSASQSNASYSLTPSTTFLAAPIMCSYPYATNTATIHLAYGHNYIEVAWTEGGDPTTISSTIEDLDLKATDGSGNYTLTIMDMSGDQVLDSPESGIVCAPWQPLILSISAASGADTADLSWDFGDALAQPPDGATTVQHAYQDAPGQITSSASYTLRISLKNQPTTEVLFQEKVTVLDTQAGSLWGPEEWHGNHTVLGEIIVPTGMTLHIATTSAAPSETVSFQGNPVNGSMQGIMVEGGLTVDGGVTFQPAAGQSEGWGTILVEGSASIGAASGSGVTITGADRGLAVDTSGTATISNTAFQANTTGLQVYGTTAVTVTLCTFTGNTVYGIKEDAGGRPAVKNTSFSGNFRSYYEYDQAGGVISIADLNKLNSPNNYGNSGE